MVCPQGALSHFGGKLYYNRLITIKKWYFFCIINQSVTDKMQFFCSAIVVFLPFFASIY